MALISCRECGARISDEAVRCPSCGARNIKPTSTKLRALQAVFLVAIILAFAVYIALAVIPN